MASLGAAVWFLLILTVVFLVFIMLCVFEVPQTKLIFWAVILPLYILFIIIFSTLPYKDEDDDKVESNPHFAALCSFGVFIFVGFAVSLAFYIIVVLCHQDKAGRILKNS